MNRLPSRFRFSFFFKRDEWLLFFFVILCHRLTRSALGNRLLLVAADRHKFLTSQWPTHDVFYWPGEENNGAANCRAHRAATSTLLSSTGQNIRTLNRPTARAGVHCPRHRLQSALLLCAFFQTFRIFVVMLTNNHFLQCSTEEGETHWKASCKKEGRRGK